MTPKQDYEIVGHDEPDSAYGLVLYVTGPGLVDGTQFVEATRLSAAETERDEWKKRQGLTADGKVAWERDGRIMAEGSVEVLSGHLASTAESLRAAEARVEALSEALDAACDVATWMSGSRSFSPEGEAHEGWVKQRERLYEAMAVRSARAALACPPQQPPAWPGAGPDERDYSSETP